MGSNLKIQNLHLLKVQVSELPLIPMFSMFNSISSLRTRSFPQFRTSIKTSLPFNKLHSLSLSSSPVPVSLSENSSNEHSFEVSYLINTFGWSPELASSRGKNLKFNTSEKPDNVLDVLKKYGFTKTQISSIVERCPPLILCDPQKTLLPKLGFLSSIGLSTTEIPSFITAAPYILKSSLKNKIIPAYNLLRNLVGSDDKAIEMIKRHRSVLICDPEVENIQILQEVGVPKENIVVFISDMHLGRMTTADTFRMIVERVKEMGFDPSHMKFLQAIRSMRLNEHSFEISYLVNTFGWSQELAISRAKSLKFNTSERPDNVLALLKKHGFTKTRISSIVEKYPECILCNPQKTLLPKLEFLSSIGLSTTEIPSVITAAPLILKMSLKNGVIPLYNLLCNLVGSDNKAVEMIKRYPVILTHDPEVDNIQILQEVGVPKANIVVFWTHQRWGSRTPTADTFRMIVERVKEMGFDPSRMKFLWAIRSMRFMSESTWERKVQALKKYGWSDREILLAFEKHPVYITMSEDKIAAIMDFLVNIMGMEAATIANCPTIFHYSLEKRIVPRCLVYQVLLEKGFFNSKRNLSIRTYLSYTENKFIIRVIEPYENEVPELLNFYQEMLSKSK